MANPQHLRIPLALGADGSFDTVEQDSLDDIVQCVTVVAATPIGSRKELPAFGIPRTEFSQPMPLVSVLTALYTWEPRASLLISGQPSDTDALEFDLRMIVGNP